MASKKQSEVKAGNKEEVKEPAFVAGDYFSALYKRGKKEPIKIRGIIGYYGGYDTFYLANNQAGDENCDEEGFSFEVCVRGNTLSHLEKAGISEFHVITDARAKKVIDNDKLPEIASHSARKKTNGDISFGCGSIEFTKEEIQLWLKFMEKIKTMKGWKEFLSMNYLIFGEIDDDALASIDLRDVKKLLE